MNKLFVLLPCYNEEENISTLIDSWMELNGKIKCYDYELIIVPIDDGSKDNTKKIILKRGEEIPAVTPLIHEANQGLGGAILTGFKHFNQVGRIGDLAVIMDADNTHEPRYIFDMIEEMKKKAADCVIASRYEKDSKTVGVPGFREFLSFGARMYYTMVLHVKNVKDYTCGYRLYTYDIVNLGINTYGDELVQEKGFSCMMEVLYKLYKLGGQFSEVGFELRYDQKLGESKMRVAKTIKSSLTTAVKLRRKGKVKC